MGLNQPQSQRSSALMEYDFPHLPDSSVHLQPATSDSEPKFQSFPQEKCPKSSLLNVYLVNMGRQLEDATPITNKWMPETYGGKMGIFDVPQEMISRIWLAPCRSLSFTPSVGCLSFVRAAKWWHPVPG
jgi:hypothetical protein